MNIKHLFSGMMLMLLPSLSSAANLPLPDAQDFTSAWYGIVAIGLFLVAYTLVIFEEVTGLKKSKPVMLAAGLIWVLVAMAYSSIGETNATAAYLNHNVLEYGLLMLFLLAAMTYINSLTERNVFGALRDWLIVRGFSYRALFWVTGILAFFISPIADNLTTALLMAAVVMAVAKDNMKFIVMGCINIVVAANAGGAFSPFGDITTLMVWQKGVLPFQDFFALFLPSLVNWIIPAAIMSIFIDKGTPQSEGVTQSQIKIGGITIIFLFLATIATAVSFHAIWHLPPAIGMMTGLAYLKIYGFFLNKRELAYFNEHQDSDIMINTSPADDSRGFDVFKQLERSEWDTLMFFYGVVLCVGGLSALGYLASISTLMYTDLGATNANILVGILSAIVDNIPVMFAVLTMFPSMDAGQWLLVTLTAGVGGSLLSIGSAAGVALMGQAHGIYTFGAHLKWVWAIALGYISSIAVHLWINALWFDGVPVVLKSVG